MPPFVSLDSLLRKKPPTFEEATSVRHKAWAAGFDPAYWYAVEFDENVKRGQVVEVVFQGTSVALYRGEDGRLAAIENRCAHRQVKLSDGKVRGCEVACRYHGWTFDADGRLTGIQHDLGGRPFPKARVRSYPVAVKYGIVFVFFGDPALMESRPLPHIPDLEGEDPWMAVPIDFTMKSHPTAYVNNVMDSTHVAALHRQFRTRSFIYGKVTRCETKGDTVVISHEIEFDPGGMLRHMVLPLRHKTQDAFYEYPYMHVHVGGIFQLWNFMLPIDANTTRIFLLSMSDRARVPFTDIPIPDAVTKPFIKIAREILVRPLFDEDVWSTEAEQRGYERYFDERELDPHPSIRPSYQLTVRKWEEYLAREAAAGNACDDADCAAAEE